MRGRHARPRTPPRLLRAALAPADRDLSDRPLHVGLLAAVGLWLFLVALSAPDHLAARGHPVERVVVIGVGSTGERLGCGYRAVLDNTDEQATTYVSRDAPPGRSTVLQTTGCPGGEEVGDTDTAVRDGEDVLLSPLSTVRLWLTWSLDLVAGAFVLASVGAWVARLLRRRGWSG